MKPPMPRSACVALGSFVGLLAATARAQEMPPGPYTPPVPHHKPEWVIGPAMGAFFAPEAERAGLALQVSLVREFDDWAVAFQSTFATTDSQADSGVQFVALSAGGRRYFGEGTVSAFVGAGLALSSLTEPGGTVTVTDSLCFFSCEVTQTSRREQLKGAGGGAYAEAGFELFRDHPIRLIASVRIDVPFYTLPLDDTLIGDTTTETGLTRRYEPPLTFNLGVGF